MRARRLEGWNAVTCIVLNALTPLRRPVSHSLLPAVFSGNEVTTTSYYNLSIRHVCVVAYEFSSACCVLLSLRSAGAFLSRVSFITYIVVPFLPHSSPTISPGKRLALPTPPANSCLHCAPVALVQAQCGLGYALCVFERLIELPPVCGSVAL